MRRAHEVRTAHFIKKRAGAKRPPCFVANFSFLSHSLLFSKKVCYCSRWILLFVCPFSLTLKYKGV